MCGTKRDGIMVQSLKVRGESLRSVEGLRDRVG